MTEIDNLECGEAHWRFYSAINALEDDWIRFKRWIRGLFKRKYETQPPYHNGAKWENNTAIDYSEVMKIFCERPERKYDLVNQREKNDRNSLR